MANKNDVYMMYIPRDPEKQDNFSRLRLSDMLDMEEKTSFIPEYHSDTGRGTALITNQKISVAMLLVKPTFHVCRASRGDAVWSAVAAAATCG